MQANATQRLCLATKADRQQTRLQKTWAFAEPQLKEQSERLGLPLAVLPAQDPAFGARITMRGRAVTWSEESRAAVTLSIKAKRRFTGLSRRPSLQGRFARARASTMSTNAAWTIDQPTSGCSRQWRLTPSFITRVRSTQTQSSSSRTAER